MGSFASISRCARRVRFARDAHMADKAQTEHKRAVFGCRTTLVTDDLVELDASRPHDLDPSGAFLGEQRGEILRRAAEGIAAKLLECAFHVVGGEGLVDRPVGPRDTSAGVPAGPATAVHDTATTPGTPLSAIVGSAGSSGLRVRLVTASGRILPSGICARGAGVGSSRMSVLPGSMGVMVVGGARAGAGG